MVSAPSPPSSVSKPSLPMSMSALPRPERLSFPRRPRSGWRAHRPCRSWRRRAGPGLDIGVQRENVDRGGDRVLAVAARADRLVDDIRNDIHKVSIIAGRADHRIGFAAESADRGIVPAEPEELVVLCVLPTMTLMPELPGGGDCHASQRQRLDVRAQRIVDLGKDDVRPLTRHLDDTIAGIVDIVDVVARRLPSCWCRSPRRAYRCRRSR